MNYNSDGVIYRNWALANSPQRLVTGARANAFFITAMRDRLQPGKDPAVLRDRYVGNVADIGTFSKQLYAMQRGRSYPAEWGYVWDEFTAGQTYQSSNYNALQYDSMGEPAHYLDLSSHGGARDSTDGRGSTEEAAVVLWAALHDPDGRIKVAGGPGSRYIDYATDAIHSAAALLMTDTGAMREAYQGTLGKGSAVTSHLLTADFSGYFLTLLAYYHLYQRDVSNPMPVNALDYVQGIGEHEGVTTIKYLGDDTISQQLAVPYTNCPVLAGGVFTTPALTVEPGGEITQLASKTLQLAATLPEKSLASGTLQQVPLRLTPTLGSGEVTVNSWSKNLMQWTEHAEQSAESVAHTVWGLQAGQAYLVTVDDQPYTQQTADSAGQITFTYDDGFSTTTFAIVPASTSQPHAAGMEIVAHGTSSTCAAAEPGAAPNLYAAIAQGSSQIELYFAEGEGPYDHYALEYGTGLGEYRFGAVNIAGRDARTYTVKSLSPSTTYYLRLRFGNGCAPGPWSNALAATTQAVAAQGGLQTRIVERQAAPQDNDRQDNPSNRQRTDTPSSYDVLVKIVNSRQQPVVDALVTLHSTPRSARTDDTGSVHFRDVTAGQHELVIVADGYEGHQSLHLSGDARQIALTVQVEPTGPLRVVARTSLLGLIILVLMGVVMRARRIASLLRLRRAVMTALRRWSPRSRH